MKRSVRKNKRQQQAAGCSMDKNIGTATKHTKSQLSGRNGKNAPRSPPQKHENKYTARHQLLRLPILVLLAAAVCCAETPVLLSAANGAHIQPRDLSRDFAGFGCSKQHIPVFCGRGADNFRRHASCGHTRCAAVQTRVFKTPETETQSNALLQLPDFARNVCGRNAESFLCILGINHYRMPAASILGFSDELARVNSAKSEFIAAAETGDDSASSDIYAEMLASTCEKIAAAAAENRSRLRENENGVFIADNKTQRIRLYPQYSKAFKRHMPRSAVKTNCSAIPSFPQNRCIFKHALAP